VVWVFLVSWSCSMTHSSFWMFTESIMATAKCHSACLSSWFAVVARVITGSHHNRTSIKGKRKWYPYEEGQSGWSASYIWSHSCRRGIGPPPAFIPCSASDSIQSDAAFTDGHPITCNGCQVLGYSVQTIRSCLPPQVKLQWLFTVLAIIWFRFWIIGAMYSVTSAGFCPVVMKKLQLILKLKKWTLLRLI